MLAMSTPAQEINKFTQHLNGTEICSSFSGGAGFSSSTPLSTLSYFTDMTNFNNHLGNIVKEMRDQLVLSRGAQ